MSSYWLYSLPSSLQYPVTTAGLSVSAQSGPPWIPLLINKSTETSGWALIGGHRAPKVPKVLKSCALVPRKAGTTELLIPSVCMDLICLTITMLKLKSFLFSACRWELSSWRQTAMRMETPRMTLRSTDPSRQPLHLLRMVSTALHHQLYHLIFHLASFLILSAMTVNYESKLNEL